MSLVDLVHRVFTGPSFHVFFLVFRPAGVNEKEFEWLPLAPSHCISLQEF